MTRSTRITFLAHAPVRAPGDAGFLGDEPLAAGGPARVAAIGPEIGHFRACLCAPERRAHQTAAALVSNWEIDGDLRDLDNGRWTGLRLAEVQETDAAGLVAMIGSADSAPHGGESVAALVARMNGWLAAHIDSGGRLLAVTHPAVIRAAVVAALGAPAEAFWHVEAEPLSRLDLSSDGRRWALRALNPPRQVGPA